MIELVRCRIRHLHAVVVALRAEEREECALAGVKPQRKMLALYRQTPEPWAGLCDNKVLAVWGDSAPVLSSDGHIWFFTSSHIETMPLAFVREVKAWMGRYLEKRETIRSSVGERCERAVRFYQMLGFDVGEPVGGFRDIRLERG